jgi:hypothetical protein
MAAEGGLIVKIVDAETMARIDAFHGGCGIASADLMAADGRATSG